MKALPKIPHLLTVGRDSLLTSFPEWDGWAKAGQAWRLRTQDRDYIRQPPSHHAPAGYPYGFNSAQEAVDFGVACLQKLDRHSKRAP